MTFRIATESMLDKISDKSKREEARTSIQTALTLLEKETMSIETVAAIIASKL